MKSEQPQHRNGTPTEAATQPAGVSFATTLPTQPTFRIVVIVVTYNGRKWLDQCIGTLFDDPNVQLKVIVVDNDSTDGTPDSIRRNWPAVELIEPGSNLGFGQANNMGLKYALDMGFDYAYLLNQDAWIEPKDIARLAQLQSLYKQYGVLSPMQMQANMTNPDRFFDTCCEESNCKGYKYDISLGKPLKDVYEIGNVMAAHWLISAEAIRRIGGFAPIFKHYGEDYNYLDRLKYHGLKAGICPAIKAVHDRENRADWNQDMNKAIYMLYNSKFLHNACNINKSTLAAFTKGFIIIVKNAISQTKKFRSIKPMKNLFKALFNMGKIMATRKETKQEGPLFL